MAFVWVQLWAPLYAVLNYIATLESASGALAGRGQGIAGFTLSTTAVIGSTLISDQAVAGMMTLAIPVIATMIVTGGAQALTSMTGPSWARPKAVPRRRGRPRALESRVRERDVGHRKLGEPQREQWALSSSTTSPFRSSFSDVAGTVETGAGAYRAGLQPRIRAGAS